ncbi:dihydrofolate reductase family protein [Amnibacterium sp. CER49]|uniref:dihydrofolate reductase family protein n=1 Tax=Amnibacterium sp. CER49 TaxID=3039161 RepID=UPI002449F221|nr:dihydrofolate reductase family protein [Amnibacterium sp. CER49]MDH2444815.1 dihydrofolate reductase family protein [Amnibacterium sp. CER49]
MGSIVVQEFISLDGVIQGGGGPDEDRDGGFDLGGWAMDFDAAHDRADEGGPVVIGWERGIAALLLGRRTYEIWAGAWGVWPEDAEGQMGEFTRLYNRIPKYVASRTLTEVGWRGSQLLGDDVPGAVARLKHEIDGEVRVWGSSVLVRTLAEHDLVDEYRLMQYPVVLGTGKRLFPDGFPRTSLALAETRALGSGVVISTYRREH